MTHDTGSKASSEALDSGFRESSSLRHSEQRALPCSGNMWKHLPPQGSYCTYGACSIISLAFSTAKPAVALEQEGWGLNPEAGDRSDKSVNSTARGTYQRCMFTVPSAVPSATSITWRVIIAIIWASGREKSSCAASNCRTYKTRKDQRKQLRRVSRTSRISRPNDSCCSFFGKTLSKCKRVNASQANGPIISESRAHSPSALSQS
jgi:hypothetical protein